MKQQKTMSERDLLMAESNQSQCCGYTVFKKTRRKVTKQDRNVAH